MQVFPQAIEAIDEISKGNRLCVSSVLDVRTWPASDLRHRQLPLGVTGIEIAGFAPASAIWKNPQPAAVYSMIALHQSCSSFSLAINFIGLDNRGTRAAAALDHAQRTDYDFSK
jgi:hypothetical protein